MYYSVTVPSCEFPAHNLRTDSHRDTSPHTHLAASGFLGPELSDAECRRESRQALTGSTTQRYRGEDYSEFLICVVGQLGEQRLFVCKETQRWKGRPLGKKVSRGELWGFVALRLALVAAELRPAMTLHKAEHHGDHEG